MKYKGAKLRQMLAAEYVLGTLRGPARARFRRLLEQDVGIQIEVRYWEARLAGLHAALKPVAPRELVWAGLERAINTSKVTALPALRQARAPVNFWRAWAAVSTAASVLMGFGLWNEMRQGTQFVTIPKIVRVEVPAKQTMPYVALLQPAKSEAKWVISMYPDRATMKVAVAGQYAMDEKHSLELWILEKSGPRSLGVLPVRGQMEMPLPKNMPMEGEVTLAVSMEPKGGSPTGSPTGPVILSAPALRAL